MSATAYVKFSDVPAAYEVALSDGRVLEENASKPVVVTTQTVSISVKATNGSKGVTVNGWPCIRAAAIRFTRRDPIAEGCQRSGDRRELGIENPDHQ